MINKLQEIHTSTSGTAVVVGGVAKWLNGYQDEPTRMWIDIAVSPAVTSSLDILGARLEIKGGTTFPLPVKEQYVIKSGTYYLDVFVRDELPQSSVISGINVQTAQADLDYHLIVSSSLPSEDIHNKVVNLKSLYGL